MHLFCYLTVSILYCSSSMLLKGSNIYLVKTLVGSAFLGIMGSFIIQYIVVDWEEQCLLLSGKVEGQGSCIVNRNHNSENPNCSSPQP